MGRLAQGEKNREVCSEGMLERGAKWHNTPSAHRTLPPQPSLCKSSWGSQSIHPNTSPHNPMAPSSNPNWTTLTQVHLLLPAPTWGFSRPQLHSVQCYWASYQSRGTLQPLFPHGLSRTSNSKAVAQACLLKHTWHNMAAILDSLQPCKFTPEHLL